MKMWFNFSSKEKKVRMKNLNAKRAHKPHTETNTHTSFEHTQVVQESDRIEIFWGCRTVIVSVYTHALMKTTLFVASLRARVNRNESELIFGLSGLVCRLVPNINEKKNDQCRENAR